MRLSPLAWTVLLPYASLPVDAAQDITGKPVLKLGTETPVDTPGTYWTALHACPKPCKGSPSNWTVYNSVDRLATCDKPLLLDFALYNDLKNSAVVKIHACTTSGGANSNQKHGTRSESAASHKADSATCLPMVKENKVSVPFSFSGGSSAKGDDALQALDIVKGQLEESGCKSSVLFSYVNGTAVGLYAGQGIDKSTASSFVEAMNSRIKSGASSRMQAQVCSEKRNAHHVLGVSVSTDGDLAAVQKDISSWANAECVKAAESQSTQTLTVKERDYKTHGASFNGTASNYTLGTKKLHARDDCQVINVVAGDTCEKLAERCGISPANFTKYNSGSDFCSKLVPDGRACCSSGDLPDIRPKKNDDGSCASYLVVANDNCSKLAAKYGLTMDDIEGFNKKTTWGWNGCERLLSGMNICLSDGSPPMPAPLDNAVCGPQKPGSERPDDDTSIENMNPCPLKACCNIWGQCGISGDFCVAKRGPLGNPGTAPPGVNGCVSSCGMGIANDRQPPKSFGRVGYYETWNMERPCLTLQASHANTDLSYTIIHWAFAEVNPDFTVHIKDDYGQWEDFKALRNVKKVLSFGGWGYSTEPATYNILREAMSPANRDTFAFNIVSFINKEGLDGVDFDWEYPGALDIPGTPPGKPDDGVNYLKFLTKMRSLIGKPTETFTISIAAPASYWYLKTFPIDKMAKVLDYIVYMTYDLHGQWDAGNKFSDEGCPGGNCLRSHVNLTETTTALSMITKAGVSTNKIFVGESSYGRSFKMSQAGCTGPDCNFLGDRLNSPAKKGRCTQTSGYISNAELNEIMDFNDNVKSWHDGDSNSDIIVYDDTEWVAYMSETTKGTRRQLWEGKNFAGTIDWAVDLQEFNDEDDMDWWFPDPPIKSVVGCDGDYKDLDSIPKDAPAQCKNLYILQAMKHTLEDSLKEYNDLLSGGYDKKFETYADAVVKGGNEAIEKFMFTKGKDYFDCVVTETYTCCDYCNHVHPSVHGSVKACMYCENYDCGWDPSCNPNFGCPNRIESRYKNVTVTCPPDYSKRSEDPPDYEHNVYNHASTYWTLRDDRKDTFWKDFYLDTGIDKDNVEFQDVERLPCTPSKSPEECRDEDHDFNFPRTHDYKREDIANPEDLIKQVYDKLQGLGPQISNSIDQIKSGTFAGSSYDVVDAVSLSIQMVDDAVDNMKTISDTVDEWDAEKRKSIILAFVTAIFLVIPVLGEIAGSLTAVASIARIAAIVGVAGNTALDVYSIVDDPKNAPLAIFSLVLEPLSLVDVAKMAKAGSLRRGMKEEDLKALHPKPGSKLDKIEEIKNVCRAPVKRDQMFASMPMSSLHGVKYNKGF